MVSWLWQRLSGIGLLVVLFIHLIMTHLYPLSYENVKVRLSSPEWIFLNILLLGLSISHALNGFWQIGQDYITNPGRKHVLGLVLWVIGIGLATLGLWVLFR